MTRFVNTHRSKLYDLNQQICIERFDGPSLGGAFARYRVRCDGVTGHRFEVQFHSGGESRAEIPSTIPNGITNEVLLAIVADRLECFQAGPNPCQENENAANKIREAIVWLHQRANRLEHDRIERDKAERLGIEKPEPAE